MPSNLCHLGATAGAPSSLCHPSATGTSLRHLSFALQRTRETSSAFSILPFTSTTPGVHHTATPPFLHRLGTLRAGGRCCWGCLPSALRRQSAAAAARRAPAAPGPWPSAVTEAPSPVPGQRGVKGCGDVPGGGAAPALMRSSRGGFQTWPASNEATRARSEGDWNK